MKAMDWCAGLAALAAVMAGTLNAVQGEWITVIWCCIALGWIYNAVTADHRCSRLEEELDRK